MNDRVPGRLALIDGHIVLARPATQAQFLDKIELRYATTHDTFPYDYLIFLTFLRTEAPSNISAATVTSRIFLIFVPPILLNPAEFASKEGPAGMLCANQFPRAAGALGKDGGHREVHGLVEIIRSVQKHRSEECLSYGVICSHPETPRWGKFPWCGG